MSDTSALLANTQALSSDCLYNLKPSAVRSRQYRASIPSSNKSTFAPSDTVIAYVPCRRNCFLDTAQSYIRFTVKNNEASAGKSINVDGTANSFINRLDIYHGSNLLETIQQYDVLNSYIADFNLDYGERYGLETSMGCTANRAGVQIAATKQKTFCVPLLSGVVGVLADKFLPLSLADDIRLEFTLNSNALAGAWSATGATAYSIINFELQLTIVELSDEGMRMVEQVTPFTEPIYMHGTSYRHFSSTLASGSSGQQSFLVPARFASLKSLAMLPRCSTETTVENAYSISSRVNPNIDTYWWRIGSLLVPQKSVTLKNSNSTGGYAEGFAEVLRAWHSLNSSSASSSIPMEYYQMADAAVTVGGVAQRDGTNTYKNAFAIAQELESFANRGDVILSGTNTLNLQVFFEYSCDTAISLGSYTLNFFACYDHIIVLEPTGLLSVKF